MSETTAKTKRVKTMTLAKGYRYPEIPEALLDHRYEQSQHAEYRVVAFTTSTAWGPGSVAASRAQVEPTVTRDNEQLFRTYHPSLSCAMTVGIFTEGSGRAIWYAEHFQSAPTHTHAGDLEVHVVPGAYPIDTLHYPLAGRDTIHYAINPRRLLSSEDIHQFADMFPRAIGLQIFIAGRIHVLYQDRTYVEADWREGVPQQVGGLAVQFSVPSIIPSQAELTYRQGVAAKKDSRIATGCLGVSLRLPDGEVVATTVTHGFVHLPGVGYLSRAVGLFDKLKKSLLRLRWPPQQESLTGHVRSSDPAGNSPVGKEVWVAATNCRLGTIGHTFDRPSRYLPYPHGYGHDLSLVSDCLGRTLVPQPYLPTVDGWADMRKVLDGGPLFLTAQLLHLGPHATNKSVFGTVTGEEAQEAILTEADDAMAEGHQYFFDRETLDVSVALLWRVVPKDQTRNMTVSGFSGSVLCLGRPSDRTAKAVVFQNFEFPVCIPRIEGGRIVESHDMPTFNIKAGFLLPKEILESEIVYTERSVSQRLSSFPARQLGREVSAESRRSVSGPQ
ncbi:hypothetical protein QBC33DRAFT_553309 [Phialemonium atrogriseum]|uniref:Uncharacterized protein n=1 Tax=Phialemonium atrogriseum TaxID=1093897 RepID=A0AAJ0BRH8_9PEZI|nr:uncharacterized protein QBC33DRAFT_553309 [Phialemonium atrogriseum]KAK1761794.1 hypothetical protein QBC33DRAFT_553309 [Phialemonium atrogriseum]